LGIKLLFFLLIHPLLKTAYALLKVYANIIKIPNLEIKEIYKARLKNIKEVPR